MKKIIAFTLTFLVILTSSLTAFADSPAGIWVITRGEQKMENFEVLILNEDKTGELYYINLAWSFTGVKYFKWSLSGNKLKISVTDDSKSYSSLKNLSVSFNSPMDYSYRNGVVYAGDYKMTKILLTVIK